MSQRWTGSPRRDDAQSNCRRRRYQAAKPHDSQRVKDNAFHLALGALVREYFRNSKNEVIRF
jgi:hypothetical protein